MGRACGGSSPPPRISVHSFSDVVSGELVSVSRSIDSSEREAVAEEERCWVRLTRVCNNRCLFCLDSGAQDGSIAEMDEAVSAMKAGRSRNAARLILSGGEPTIHPRFVEMVARGRMLGYTWIQAITNGRMLAYRSFVKDALRAGLNEVTLSLPAHEPVLFDKLVGVKRAFQQALAGLRNALAEPSLVVSVDIVLNRLNIGVLPEIIEFYLNEGVREFDLLQIVPFGRAYDPTHPAGGPLLYDPGDEAEPLREALRLADRPDVVIWTNRLDPRYLEGFEKLIQDPHKISDEVRGRIVSLEAFAGGTPLQCSAPARCRLCFLRRYCDHLEKSRDTILDDGPSLDRKKTEAAAPFWWRVANMDDVNKLFSRAAHCGPIQRICVKTRNISTAARIMREISDRLKGSENKRTTMDEKVAPCWMIELDDLPQSSDGYSSERVNDEESKTEDERIAGVVESGFCEGHRVKSLVLHRRGDLRAALVASGFQCEVSVGLNKETLDVLTAIPDEKQHPARMKTKDYKINVFLEERLKLGNSIEHDVDPRTLFCRSGASRVGIIAQDIPPCLGCGAESDRGPLIFDVSLISDEGFLDPARFVDFHIRSGYRVHSLRCESCIERGTCSGAPVQMIRNFGFGILTPIEK